MSSRVRIALSLVDQGVSSFTNILVIAFAAYLLRPTPFGQFAIAYTAAMLVIGLLRVMVSQPLLLIAAESSKRDGSAPAVRSVVSLTLVISLPLSLMGGVIAAAADMGVWTSLALASALTLTLLQDVLRYVAVSRQRAQLALGSDTLWCALLVVGFVAASARMASPAAALLLWLGSGAMSVLPLLTLLGSDRAERQPASRTMQLFWPAGRRLAVEFGAITVSGQVVLLATAALLDASATGALRGAYSFFGVLNVVYAAMSLAVIPEVRKRYTSGADQEGRRLALVSGFIVLALTAALSGVALSPLGTWALRLLGETGAGILSVAPALGARYLATAVITSLGIYLRALGQLRIPMLLQLYAAPLQAAAGIAACWTGQVAVVAWTLAFCEIATAIVFAALVVSRRPSFVRLRISSAAEEGPMIDHNPLGSRREA